MSYPPLCYQVVAGVFCVLCGVVFGLLGLSGTASWLLPLVAALAESSALLLWHYRRPKVVLGLVEDGHGNAWMRCGPRCDLRVVRPGKVECSCERRS